MGPAQGSQKREFKK
jgi:carboxy-terminal domain RNA polymerase II polypeptide A small phosphatase